MRIDIIKQKHKADNLFTLILFFVFSMMIVFIMVSGGQVYKNITDDMDENYTSRTALSYISNKVKQNDIRGGVHIEKFEDVDAIILTEEINDVEYETLIYCYEGSIREMFVEKGNRLLMGDGIPIIDAKNLHIDKESHNLICVQLETDRNNKYQMLLNLRSGGDEF